MERKGKTSTEEKLNKLSELKSTMDELEAQRDEEVKTVLTPEPQAQVDKIFDKWDSSIEDTKAQMTKLREEIESEVLSGGKTVKGARLMGVWNKGRVSWDSKKLDGMMALIPQLTEARKVGEPTVSIREVK